MIRRTLFSLAFNLFIVLASPSVFADIHECDATPAAAPTTGELPTQETWHKLERFQDNRVLRLVRCRSAMVSTYWKHRVELSVWEEGRQLSYQTILYATATSSSIDVDVDDEGVRIRWACGDTSADERRGCDRRWRWSERYQRFVGTDGYAVTWKGGVPTVDHDEDGESEEQWLTAYEKALKTHDIEAASRAVAVIGEILRPGNRSTVQALENRVFRVTHQRARELVEKGQKTKAAKLANELVSARFSRRQAPQDTVWRAGAFAFSGDHEWVTMVTELAVILVDGGEPKAAIPLLRDVLKSFSKATDARLALADALWATGKRRESAKEYRRFIERRENMLDPQIPERATKRAAPR